MSKYIAKYSSYGFRGRGWAKGESVEISAIEAKKSPNKEDMVQMWLNSSKLKMFPQLWKFYQMELFEGLNILGFLKY